MSEQQYHGNVQRLQKIIAQSGVCSRREAENLIAAGRVQVNGRTITQMGYKIDPADCTVTVDGAPLQAEGKIYILLNKPRGYVTTLSDPQGRPIVSDLLKKIPARLFPVGRLDLDTEGALIMTNDGELGNYVLHPKYEVKKTYIATVIGRPDADGLHRLSQGIFLEGRKTAPAKLRVLKQLQGKTQIEIIIHEGKKRQVRKMFQAIGHPVTHLRRTAYGRLPLGSLAPGEYRKLSLQDLKKIFSGKIPFTIKNIPA